jgi:hypothetical protein
MARAEVVVTPAGKVKAVIVDGTDITGVISAPGSALILTGLDLPELNVRILPDAISIVPDGG